MNNQKIIDNTAGVTLAATLSAVATSATLATGKGALFPLLTDGSFYRVNLTQGGATETSFEQCRTVGVASGDVLPLTNRGETGTAAAWAIGDKFECRLGSKTLNTLVDQANRQIYASSQVVTVGDSFLAFGNDANGSYSSSVLDWVNDYLRAGGNVGFDVTTRLAVNGWTLEQIISTQLGSAAVTAARTVWFHGGVNDLNATTANNDSIAALIPLYKQIFDTLSPVKDLIVVEGLTPVNQAGTGTAGPRAYQTESVNSLLNHLCAQYPNILFLNPYDAVLDFTSNALAPVTNATRPDGLHPSSLGARLQARSYMPKILDRVQLTRYKSKGTNLAPTFPQDAGGTVTPGGFVTVTGAPPTGWELLGVSGVAASLSCTISLLAPDLVRFAFVNTGSLATTYLRASNLQGTLVSGNVLQAGFGFQTHDNTALNRLAVSIRLNSTGAVFTGMGAGGQESPVVYPQVSHTGFRCTPPYPLPSTPTNVELIIQMSVGTGNTTIDVYAPELNLLT